jgi:hypothetical protein
MTILPNPLRFCQSYLILLPYSGRSGAQARHLRMHTMRPNALHPEKSDGCADLSQHHVWRWEPSYRAFFSSLPALVHRFWNAACRVPPCANHAVPADNIPLTPLLCVRIENSSAQVNLYSATMPGVNPIVIFESMKMSSRLLSHI